MRDPFIVWFFEDLEQKCEDFNDRRWKLRVRAYLRWRAFRARVLRAVGRDPDEIQF